MPSLGEKLELSFSASKLKNKDMLSKSDPLLVVSMSEVEGAEAQEIGRTEVVKDNVNPVWMTKFIIDYHFEARQLLVLSVYDWDKGDKADPKTAPLNKKDLIGTVGLSIGQLMNAGGKGSLDLGKKNGSIIVAAEPVQVSNEAFCVSYCATDLDKKDTFSKSDPFLVFKRQNNDKSFSIVAKTEVIKKTLNPVWAPMVLPITLLCGGDENRVIKIECYDADDNGKHDLIGECETTVAQMRMGPCEANTQSLINPKKLSKKKYTNSGVLKLMEMGTRDELSFLHYIRQGCQLHFTLAVDFTTSNGDVKDSSSLHFIKQGVENEYMTAIRAIAEIVQDYDSDGYFPALGFGGKLSDGRLSHGFYMNGHKTNPNCQGVTGLLQAYYNAVNSITLHNITHLAPIINHVAGIAARCNDGRSYQILLMITNGGVNDMDATKKAIVNAAEHPMSIIIVGVGKDDFNDLRELDADNKRISHEGKLAERDIVQFVELRKFLPPNGPEDRAAARSALAKAVLEELPGQFMEWMRKRELMSAQI
ncbi:copine-8 [Hyalella azteca]|uniref:Copine-8 n=1 Tax=Hyalella azteca TaxID=294128 RepID=A0A8B7PC26_HYAAZ|nr:copine-8 [Hyalella azteca]